MLITEIEFYFISAEDRKFPHYQMTVKPSVPL